MEGGRPASVSPKHLNSRATDSQGNQPIIFSRKTRTPGVPRFRRRQGAPRNDGRKKKKKGEVPRAEGSVPAFPAAVRGGCALGPGILHPGSQPSACPQRTVRTGVTGRN